MRVLNIVHPTQYGMLVKTGVTTYTVSRQEMNQDTGNCMYVHFLKCLGNLPVPQMA